MRAKFVEEMHKTKIEKMNIKRKHYETLKYIEDNKRNAFNATRMNQKVAIRKNKKIQFDRCKSIRQEIKHEQMKIESMISKARRETQE